MRNFYQTAAWVLGLLCLIVALLYWVLIALMIPASWRSVQGMPLPPWSVPQMTMYTEDERCGAGACERITHFTTTLPAEQIQAFYRQRLQERGWRYRCTASPDLPACFFPYDESLVALRDVFDRSDKAAIDWDPLVLQIGSPDQHGLRAVQIIEPAPVTWQALQIEPAPLRWQAYETERFDIRLLLGDWQGTGPDGRLFLMRFFGSGKVWLVGTSGDADAYPGAVYNWKQYSNTAMQLQRSWVKYPTERLICPRLPAFFQTACDQEGNDNYIVFNAELSLHLDGDTLTLADPEGHTQHMRRIAKPLNDK